uniref:Uncharacterized protein n=1 Tax=Cacopsylla melanoneura TaxID=428564 RepID=A0A8D8SSM5_9HEMI
MRLSRKYRSSTMFPRIQQLELFLIVCFMLGTTTAYNLPWWSHSTEQKINISDEKSLILKRVERVAETDGATKQENRDIVQLAAVVSNVTMNTTEGPFISNFNKETQIEQNISTTLAAYVTPKTVANDHTETITFLPLIHVESSHPHEKINLNITNFNKPLSFIIEPHGISQSINNTSFPATSVLPETVDVAPGLLNKTSVTLSSAHMNLNYSTPPDIVTLSSTHMNINYSSPADIVRNVCTNKSDMLDSSKGVLNSNVSQDGLLGNPKIDSMKSKNLTLRILSVDISTEDTNNEETESDPDEELEDDIKDNEQPGMFRKFLETITINPDDMEPRETQDVITNGDILTALVFPIFMVVLVGVSLYTIHNMRSYFILRFPRLPRRNNGQGPPHFPNNDDLTDIPLDSIAIPISEEQNDDVKISNEKEEIEVTDLLKPVHPEPQLDILIPIPNPEDKKHSGSSLRRLLENRQHDKKEDKTEEKIQHRSSFRNFLDEIMNDQNKPEEKLEAKEKESQDLELEQHPTE